MNYWLLKSEPNTWSWSDQKKVSKTMWEGVRNYQARNNLNGPLRNHILFDEKHSELLAQSRWTQVSLFAVEYSVATPRPCDRPDRYRNRRSPDHDACVPVRSRPWPRPWSRSTGSQDRPFRPARRPACSTCRSSSPRSLRSRLT